MKNFESSLKLQHQQNITSANISGIIASTLDCAIKIDSMIFKTSNLKKYQRFVAAQRFYGSPHGRFDTSYVTKKQCKTPSHLSEIETDAGLQSYFAFANFMKLLLFNLHETRTVEGSVLVAIPIQKISSVLFNGTKL